MCYTYPWKNSERKKERRQENPSCAASKNSLLSSSSKIIIGVQTRAPLESLSRLPPFSLSPFWYKSRTKKNPDEIIHCVYFIAVSFADSPRSNWFYASRGVPVTSDALWSHVTYLHPRIREHGERKIMQKEKKRKKDVRRRDVLRKKKEQEKKELPRSKRRGKQPKKWRHIRPAQLQGSEKCVRRENCSNPKEELRK